MENQLNYKLWFKSDEDSQATKYKVINLYYELCKFTVVSQPIDLGRLVVCFDHINLILKHLFMPRGISLLLVWSKYGNFPKLSGTAIKVSAVESYFYEVKVHHPEGNYKLDQNKVAY